MVSTRCVPTPWGHAVSTSSIVAARSRTRLHSGRLNSSELSVFGGVEESAGRGEVALALRVSWLTPGLCSAPLPKALIFIHLIHSLY